MEPFDEREHPATEQAEEAEEADVLAVLEGGRGAGRDPTEETSVTRCDVLDDLRRVRPLLLAYTVLSQALGRESVERKAEAIAAVHEGEPGRQRILYREGDVEDALEILRLRSVSRLDRGTEISVAEEDLIELLSVDVGEVRLLVIRLSGRTHGTRTRPG
jgi:hypothetical protein